MNPWTFTKSVENSHSLWVAEPRGDKSRAAEGHLSLSRLRPKLKQERAELRDGERQTMLDDVRAPASSRA